MALAAVLLLLGAVWTHQVASLCDKDVIDKIKAFNVETYSIDKIVGDWKLVYLEAGTSTSTFAELKCGNISFFKDGQTYRVDYNKMYAGIKEIKDNNGVFVHVGGTAEPDMTYYTVQKSDDTLALYLCSDHEDKLAPTATMVLVKVGTTEFSADLDAAEKKFKSVGLPDGEHVKSCPITTP